MTNHTAIVLILAINWAFAGHGLAENSSAQPASAPSESMPKFAPVPTSPTCGKSDTPIAQANADESCVSEQAPAVEPSQGSVVQTQPKERHQGDPAAHRKGFQTYLGMGLQTCIPDGAADCENTFPGLSWGGGIEYRFWYLGWSIDLAYGRYLVTDDADFLVSSTTTHITTSLKGYVPFDTFDAFLGFGLGYGDQTVTEERTDSEASWSTFWRAFRLSAGVGLDLLPYGFPKGFVLDLQLESFLHSGGTRCAKYGGAGPCLDAADLYGGQKDIADQLKLGTMLRYSF